MILHSWEAFDRHVRQPGIELLGHLDRYPDSILVAGCQRSQTTAVTDILSRSFRMNFHPQSPDAERDAGLILAGFYTQPSAAYCFQTTYLNERYREYFDHSKFKLIWVIRRPVPTVRSMLHHWRSSSLNRLYASVGHDHLDKVGGADARPWSRNWVSPLKKACTSYIGKVSQTSEIYSVLGPDRMMVIDCDDIAQDPHAVFSNVFGFLQRKPSVDCVGQWRKSGSAGGGLSEPQERFIQNVCADVYETAIAQKSGAQR